MASFYYQMSKSNKGCATKKKINQGFHSGNARKYNLRQSYEATVRQIKQLKGI